MVTIDDKLLFIRLIPDGKSDLPLFEVMLMLLATQAEFNGCHDILALFEILVELIPFRIKHARPIGV
ncbi:hypothetical protein IMZ48_42385 [Candidatus Bathyarchaeota archaeon]|nr:hypothetical protein [Candidatus Bathyarchaeota archaeon]